MTGPARAPSEVRVERLSKRFGRVAVLRDLDLVLAPGRITAVVGPNAAGKSTLIKSIVGLVRPDAGAGRILIDGRVVGSDHRYRERVGYMPQSARFPDHLTGREVLTLLLGLRGNPADADRELIDRFALEASLDQPIRTLSGGTRQKLNAAVAFLFRPSLVILDEPTAGLDPLACAILKDKVLATPAAGGTVLLSSHIMSEIEELAQDVVFLVEGRVAYQGSIGDLVASTGEPRLERAIARLMGGVR
jgi:Cu-processing system ATP-binding protein